MLTTGLDGGRTTTSASPIASTTPVPVGPAPCRRTGSPKLAVRPGTAPTTAGSGWRFDPRGVHDHVRLHPVVAHGQQRDPGLPAFAQRRRHLVESETGIEQLGAHEVSRDVAIPEREPQRRHIVGAQFLQNAVVSSSRPQPRPASIPPPRVYITVSRSGQTFRPCSQMSSAVFPITVICASG